MLAASIGLRRAPAASIFQGMKRLLFGLFAAAVLALTPASLPAQDAAARAAAAAERQDLEDRLKRLAGMVEALQATQEAQQKRSAALAEELRTAHDESARTGNKFVTREEFKQLVEKIQELDRKREADKKLILEEIQKLAKVPASPLPPRPSNARPPSGADFTATAPKVPEKGYEHVIEKGQTLSAIVEAYRSKGIKVSLKQVLEANPNLNEKKLSVGQKIFIPLPDK